MHGCPDLTPFPRPLSSSTRFFLSLPKKHAHLYTQYEVGANRESNSHVGYSCPDWGWGAATPRQGPLKHHGTGAPGHKGTIPLCNKVAFTNPAPSTTSALQAIHRTESESGHSASTRVTRPVWRPTSATHSSFRPNGTVPPKRLPVEPGKS